MLTSYGERRESEERERETETDRERQREMGDKKGERKNRLS